MTSYGFRLFGIELRRESGRTPMDFCQKSEDSTWRYREHAHFLLESHLGRRVWAEPHNDAQVIGDDEDAISDESSRRPIFVVDEMGRLGGHTTFKVRYGRQAGHDIALSDPDDVDGQDLDIKRHSPSRLYRAVLLLPEEGKKGILAVEAIGRTCPRQPIVKWLKKWSYSSVVQDVPVTISGRLAPWWKLVASPLSDRQHFDRYVQDASATKLSLVSESVSADNKRYSEPVELIFKLKHEATKRRVSGFVNGWNRVFKNDRVIDAREAAHDVAQELGGDAAASMGFDDVIVAMKSDRFGDKRIRASQFADEVFTYFLDDDVSPSEQTFYSGVRAAAQRVESYGGALEWDDWPPGRL